VGGTNGGGGKKEEMTTRNSSEPQKGRGLNAGIRVDAALGKAKEGRVKSGNEHNSFRDSKMGKAIRTPTEGWIALREGSFYY